MTASLRALLANIIDYAGMFPPAQLPMDEAIRNYARYRTEPESWMLGRFICPAARLNELSPYVDELFRDGPPLAISALGRGGNDKASFLEGLKQDLRDIDSFRARHLSNANVDVIETKLPLQSVDYSEAMQIVKQALPRPYIFFELSPQPPPKLFVHGNGNQMGVKVRCGGIAAATVPSSDTLAMLIRNYRELDTPLKFTAGLHHPFRKYDSSIETKTFGFLNLFVAGVLVTVGARSVEIQLILENEGPSHFQFDNNAMSWRDLRATIPQIEAARRNNVISFGSCSFDEPREDLKALGWL